MLVVPILNEAMGIEETIRTIQGQTNKNFHVLYVDGGSKDQTIQIVERLKRPQDKLVVFSDNLGIANNWFRAISMALEHPDITHTMFFGGDDLIEPAFIEKRWN